MMPDPAPLSISERARDGLVTCMAWGILILGCFGVWKLADALIDLAAWLADLPPMPGRGW